jgi:pimeloyl-ACP methyl ester carboxylesterase
VGEKYVTTRYSYRLLTNFGPPAALSEVFRKLKIPTTIVAGGADELLLPNKYADVVRGIEPAIDVHIVPGLTHMDMLHVPAAFDAIAAAFKEKTPAN